MHSNSQLTFQNIFGYLLSEVIYIGDLNYFHLSAQEIFFLSGEGSYKQKSILDQAAEFVECSKQNILYYKPPNVVFFFANGVDNCVAKDLSKVGIKVESNDSGGDENICSRYIVKKALIFNFEELINFTKKYFSEMHLTFWITQLKTWKLLETWQ